MGQTTAKRMVMLGAILFLGGFASTLNIGGALAGNDAPPPASKTYETYVDSRGNISLPQDYASKWMYIGSWAVVNESGEGNGMHHVFTTPDVVSHYRKTGAYPDGAVLVKEVRKSQSAQMTTGMAHWTTDAEVWFVMIKDTKNRFPKNPLWGEGWGWALFKADNPRKQVATNYKKDCLGCHVPAKDNDWVYSYGYQRILGEKAKALNPAPKAKEAAARGGADMASSDSAVMRGQAVFKRCASCHSDKPGQNRLGPTLFGVVGRKAGAVSGFNYSPAMKNSGVVWARDTLDKHLADVRGFIPKNRMATLFPAGVKDPKERADVISYLETLK